MTPQPATDSGSNRSGELPLRNKLLYASGSLGANITFQTLAAWLIFFYSPPSGGERSPLVPIGVIGAILVLSRIIEAVDDPLIGYRAARSSPSRGSPARASSMAAVTFVSRYLPVLGVRGQVQ